jgi:hypothetical protein
MSVFVYPARVGMDGWLVARRHSRTNQNKGVTLHARIATLFTLATTIAVWVAGFHQWRPPR